LRKPVGGREREEEELAAVNVARVLIQIPFIVKLIMKGHATAH
jgi:hypothetical protein